MWLYIVILGLGFACFALALAAGRNPLGWFFWGVALPGLGLIILISLLVLEKCLKRNCCSYLDSCLSRHSCSAICHLGFEGRENEDIRSLFRARVAGLKAFQRGEALDAAKAQSTPELRHAWERGWFEAKTFKDSGGCDCYFDELA